MTLPNRPVESPQRDRSQLSTAIAELRGHLDDLSFEDLHAELPDPDDEAAIAIAFIGPHNAGKSSLIAALTGDMSIKRSAKPETSEAGHYPWRNGVDLVDLPGWFSGYTAHDDHAGEVLRRNADLVAFVMTVELGDELVVAAIQEVLGDLGFAERAVVVVNKAQSEDSDPDIVREEIERRLGEFAATPVLFTDAQSYLDTVSGEFDLDDESIQILTAGSGVAELGEALLSLVTRRHTTARTQAQALQSARVADAAIARLIPGADEEATRAALDELAAALDRAQAQLADLGTSHLTTLESAVASIADREIAAGGLNETERDQAWDDAHSSTDSLPVEAEQILADLTSNFGGVLTTLEFATEQPPNPGPSDNSGSSRERGTNGLSRRVLRAMGVDLKKGSKAVSKAAEKVARDGSGKDSIAYAVVRKLQPRKKFAPYERLKDAEKLRKGAGVASKAYLAVPVLEELGRWLRDAKDVRAAKKAEAAVRSHYADLAAEERRRLATEFEEWCTAGIAPFNQLLDDGRAPLVEADATRAAVRHQLSALHEKFTALATTTTEGDRV